MMDRDRLAHTRSTVGCVAAAGMLAFGAAVALAATAAADPPPEPLPVPGDPAPPPPPGPYIPGMGEAGPNLFGILAQNGQESVPGAVGAPAVAGLDATTVLGQNAVPSAPGAGPGTPPNLNVFNNAYGAGALNEVPAAPGQGTQFDVAPGQENADVGKREWLGRYIDLYRAGDLKGGLLGQMPQEQLGEPLPGTAPLPGTNVPQGLVQFQPDPADALPPGVVPPVLPPG